MSASTDKNSDFFYLNSSNLDVPLNWLYKGKRRYIKTRLLQEKLPKTALQVHKNSDNNTLSDIPTLRRFKFAVNELPGDPAQQLPSRKPKNGEILVPDDMLNNTIPSISMHIRVPSSCSSNISYIQNNQK